MLTLIFHEQKTAVAIFGIKVTHFASLSISNSISGSVISTSLSSSPWSASRRVFLFRRRSTFSSATRFQWRRSGVLRLLLCIAKTEVPHCSEPLSLSNLHEPTTSIHTDPDAFLEAAMPAGAPHVLIDDAVAVVLAGIGSVLKLGLIWEKNIGHGKSHNSKHCRHTSSHECHRELH